MSLQLLAHLLDGVLGSVAAGTAAVTGTTEGLLRFGTFSVQNFLGIPVVIISEMLELCRRIRLRRSLAGGRLLLDDVHGWLKRVPYFPRPALS